MNTDTTLEDLLAEVDRIAQGEHRSRNEVLREAIRVYIQTRRGCDPRVRRAIEIQDALGQIAPGNNEDSALDVRRWRGTP